MQPLNSAILRTFATTVFLLSTPALAQSRFGDIPVIDFVANCDVVENAVFMSRIMSVGNCEIESISRPSSHPSDLALPARFPVLGARVENGYGSVKPGSRIRLELQGILSKYAIDNDTIVSRLEFRLLPDGLAK